jgi:hypothetical protein
LVEALAPDPSKPPERATRLFGYPGASPEENATRLWLDLDLTSFVDIPNDAIRHSQTHGDDGTTVWIDPGATLTYGNVQSQQVQADFLSGSISQQHLAGAAAGGGLGPLGPGQVPTPPATLAVVCTPSVLRPCGFTQRPHCWYTETCWPTHIPPCWITRTPSACVICPTQQIWCHHTFTLQCQLHTQQLVCQIHALRTDIRAVEDRARSDLGMVYPDEIVIRIHGVTP